VLFSPLNQVIQYEYDHLYRLTEADYSTGDLYEYAYDPVGNRLQQIINGDTTSYQYDAANRLEAVSHQAMTQTYTFDNNGNLLTTGVMTNSFDTANRLVSSSRNAVTLQPLYNGVGDRVGQTVGTTTTTFALDGQGLPEVIYTSEGDLYLHLPGVIMTEKAGEVRYLLSDGLGSIRQVIDDTGTVMAYNEFDPYGNPVQQGSEPYGYTGEWYESYIDLLFLRARWYMPYLNQFISPDPIIPDYFKPQSLNQYSYAFNNPVNLTDPTGLTPNCQSQECKLELLSTEIQAGGGLLSFRRHLAMVFSDTDGTPQTLEGFPSGDPFLGDPGIIMVLASDPNNPAQLGQVQYHLDNMRSGANGAIFITLIEGDIACNKWECLKNKMEIIKAMGVPYRTTSSNSNTAVYTALKACGISLSWSEYSQEKSWNTKHPGWGTDLFSEPQPQPIPTPPTGTPTPLPGPMPPISTPTPSNYLSSMYAS
jgi:RHS repeat-associated protein